MKILIATVILTVFVLSSSAFRLSKKSLQFDCRTSLGLGPDPLSDEDKIKLEVCNEVAKGCGEHIPNDVGGYITKMEACVVEYTEVVKKCANSQGTDEEIKGCVLVYTITKLCKEKLPDDAPEEAIKKCTDASRVVFNGCKQYMPVDSPDKHIFGCMHFFLAEVVKCGKELPDKATGEKIAMCAYLGIERKQLVADIAHVHSEVAKKCENDKECVKKQIEEFEHMFVECASTDAEELGKCIIKQLAKHHLDILPIYDIKVGTLFRFIGAVHNYIEHSLQKAFSSLNDHAGELIECVKKEMDGGMPEEQAASECMKGAVEEKEPSERRIKELIRQLVSKN